MITYQQLQGITVQELENNQDLLNTVAGLYGNINPNTLLTYLQNGYYNLNKVKNYVTGEATKTQVQHDMSESLRRYTNWNNLDNETDYAKAQEEREKGLQSLNNLQSYYNNLGLDVSTIPGYKEATTSFGSTPGGGTTSQEQAQIDSQDNQSNQVTVTDNSGNTYQVTKGSPQYQTAASAGYKISGGTTGGTTTSSNTGDSTTDTTTDTESTTPAYTPDPQSIQSSYDYVDSQVAAGLLTYEEGESVKMVLDSYPPGIADDVEEIMSAYQDAKTKAIDPYYKNILDLNQSQFQANITNLETQQQLEVEQQALAEQQRIKEAQGTLESSGMTFSGKGTELLGQQSATAGVQGEGSVPTYNRMIATSDNARRTQSIMELGGSIEQKLGSGMGGLNLQNYNPATSGYEGTLDISKQGDLGSTLNQIISNYGYKQNYKTDQSYNVNTSL